MYHKSEAVQQARRELIQQLFDKICEPCKFEELKGNTCVVLSHVWLQNIATKEGLFELEEWAHPELKEQLLEKIEIFLTKHIR
jgi:hypothetical protein